MTFKHNLITSILLFGLLNLCNAEVMLQWFETDWNEIYRRLPEVAEIGYDYLWLPPPTKAPTGLGTKWGNVGYNLYDRFDIGDIPQRGSLATRYGTRGDLRNMVDKAHQCDVKIIPDIVMNHNGNGPDFRDYPGMKPEDFHIQWQEGYLNGLNYKRGPRMWEWYHGDGYGGTLWQELVSLIDIRTEPDNRFTGGNNTPNWNFVSGTSFLRHIGQYDKYPYYPNGYTNETAAQMLDRWIAWLGDAMDYDGLRLDAAKHVPYEFFGTRGYGFLHEAQYNYNLRYGYTDSSDDEADDLFKNYLAERNDALIFAEILSPWSEIEYWYGSNGNTRNPMRFLDFQIKKTADSALNGNIGDFYGYGKDFGPNNGIMYIWGHDEGPASRPRLGYAYILTHIGFPMVYFTGNNITWADNNTKTWMRPGFDSHALADQSGELANLIWIHQQFARGSENDLWHDNDYLALERYDSTATVNKGLLIAAFNDTDGDIQHTLNTSFDSGTILHDYTGHFTEEWGQGPGNIQVGSGGTVTVKVPGNAGENWVCFAPIVADNINLNFKKNGTTVPTMNWIVPGGIHAPDKPRQIPRITGTNFTVDVSFDPKGATVDSVMMKWGRGKHLSTNYYDSGNNIVSGRYEKMNQINSTNWSLNISINSTNIPEGLNVVKTRVFTQRPANSPALFNTKTKVIYVDRRGPEVTVAYPEENENIQGEDVMIIYNKDFTAYGMTVTIDTNSPAQAHEIMKGLWKLNLAGLNSGTHTALVTTTEADWGNPRSIINTSYYTRVFSVTTNTYPIALNHQENSTLQLPFFTTSVTAPGNPNRVSLFWDGYELPFNSGNYTNIFNGEIIRRDNLGNVAPDHLWGNFVNGTHFFIAERVDGSVTSRVSRTVTFNLYGINAIDSDGDGLPDNVEMPFIDSDGAPGPDAPWPGDDNRDFIPNYGENWSRLNPYNHSTYYSGEWDDRGDKDGDGYSNGAEVLAGYNEGNIYKYSIYDANSHPTGTTTSASVAVWSPEYAVRGQTLHITYTPNEGILANKSPVYIHIGHSKKTAGEWLDVTNYIMTASGNNWVVDYPVPANATSVDFVFRDQTATVWDNHNGQDWQANIQTDTNRYFTMDGIADSTNYEIFSDTMKILAAVKGSNLYVATWGVSESAGGADHFIYITDEPGPASDPAPGWSKQGQVFVDTSTKPYLTAEGSNDWEGWNNVSGSTANSPSGVLEGEFNLIDAFGYIPEYIYISAAAYGTEDGGSLLSQGPYSWDNDGNIDVPELQRVKIADITDNNLDGYFDAGKPQMWTVVGNSTNDANYGLRRFFINELAGESAQLTVILQPNAGSGHSVSDVELFSNINRRDFAKIEENPATVTTDSDNTYYRAYKMTDIGDGKYSYTIDINRCGAYRINARYRIDGDDYVYYTDHALRRDCAVVASPTKALQLTMYELNPLIAESTGIDFYSRSTFKDMYTANTNKPDYINSAHFTGLGVNMIWLQPIHPIGVDGRQIDPLTGQPYDPGSPYAVRNYWQVNSILGDPASRENAMTEFKNFVNAMDNNNVNVMLDGTFNHSAWDCEIGVQGVKMGITTNPATLIRDIRPQWYSQKDHYGDHATYYQSGANTDIAMAPDRIDFGKWPDAADFYFGKYDALVQEGPFDTNNAWSSPWYKRYLREDDELQPLDQYSKELWQYFAAYPAYWLEKTGHPAGTPKVESYKGIDGLRCDFAQGLPSKFWEYCINKTRSIKWDFIFMAESLDGYSEVHGSKHHGVGYRSSRHFDVLNENMVFYWRGQFFDYPERNNPQSYTAPTQQALADRRDAFALSPILLNLTGHDEIFPSHDPYRLVYAYAELASVDGVPMIFYGQEAGAQNDFNTYGRGGEIPNADHNFSIYELNFGKSIPNFKRYNSMTNIWIHRDWSLQNIYSRINNARQGSPALKSQNQYFLSRTDTGNYDPNIFAVAKFEDPGVSAGLQDVVLVFVNNNYWGSPDGNGTNIAAQFKLDATYGTNNYFGINPAHNYNIVDLVSTNPSAYIWTSNKAGSELINNGIYVGLNGSAQAGKQVQYLKLIDVAASYPDTDGDGVPDYTDWDDDGDGLPDWYEIQYGLDPKDATGVNGANGDPDSDGMSNLDEFRARTAANQSSDVLKIDKIMINSNSASVTWPTKENLNYILEHTDSLLPAETDWQASGMRTSISNTMTETDTLNNQTSNRFFRVNVVQ